MFDHVLSKFSGFSWEHILFLKSAFVKSKLDILEEFFFVDLPGSVEDLKKLLFA